MQSVQATPNSTKGRYKLNQPLQALQVQGSLLKIDTVCAVVGMSVSSVYHAVAAGEFPAPIKRGPRCTRWPSDAVRSWLAKQSATAERTGAL